MKATKEDKTEGLVRRLDGTEREKREDKDTRRRIASGRRQCVKTVDSGDMWQNRALEKEKENNGRENAREKTWRKEKAR